MASWKKVVVSGSDANLKSLVVSQSLSATSITGSLLGSAQSAEIVVINSDTAPTNTLSGSLWFNTDNLTLYVRYTDLSGSSYWLPSFNAGMPLSASYSFSSSLADLASTASHISNLTQKVIVTGSVETTLGITSSQLILTDNGNSTNIRIGDDVWLGDINTANTIGIRGMYNTGSGFIRFGNTATSPILGANNGSATMELSGSIAITGQIIQPTKVAFSVYGSGTTNNLSTTQNGDGTLTTNNFTIEFNQGSWLTGSSGIFTAPLPGLYQANLIARNSGYSSGISQIGILKNNSVAAGNVAMMEFAASSTMNHAGVSKLFSLAVGDTLRIKVLAGQINFDGNDSWSVVYLG